MNPITAYTFKSVTGRSVVVKSRLGLDSARRVAMEHFWGPPMPPIWPGNGLGLDLQSMEEVADGESARNNE